MFGGVPRLLYAAVERWRAVFLLGVVLVAAGVGVAAVADVPTTTQPDADSQGTITFDRHHQAQAVPNATVYEPGQPVRDRSLYLRSEAPNLTVREVVSADGPSVEVTVESRLVYEVRYDDSTVYRERNRTVRRQGTLSDGNLTAAMKMNTVAVRDRLAALQSRFGTETTVRATVSTTVAYGDGGSFTVATPLTFTSEGYSVAAPTERRQYGTVQSVRRPDPDRTVTVGGELFGHTQLLGGAVAAVGGLLALVAVGYLGRFSGLERRRLRRRVLRRRYAELVAAVEDGEAPSVDQEMRSLEDLAFVSEDAGAPMLHFEDEDRYVVQTDEDVYGYAVGGLDDSEATDPAESEAGADGSAETDGATAGGGPTGDEESDEK